MVPPRGKVRKQKAVNRGQKAVDGKQQKENSRQKRTVIEHPFLKEKVEETDWVKDDRLRSGRSSLGSPGRARWCYVFE
jgi:hypothetical protein